VRDPRVLGKSLRRGGSDERAERHRCHGRRGREGRRRRQTLLRGDAGTPSPDDAGQDGTVAFTSGTTPIFVYGSEFAGTNQANALVWDVGDDFDAILDDLRRKGVTFEHYDLPGLTLEATCMSPRTSKGCGSKTPTATSCTSTAAS
jgi:hypothetical protein